MMVRATGGWLTTLAQCHQAGEFHMARTTHTARTIRALGAVGLAALVSAGALATPAHASPVTVTETVSGSWNVVGALPGAPGNLHQGDFSVSERPLADGTPHTSAWVGFTDWQCPTGTTSPNAGTCTMLRVSGANGEDDGSAVTLGSRLTSAAVDTTFPGGWGTPGGGSVRTDFTIDLDFVGSGPLNFSVRREEFGDFTWHTIRTQERAARATGTIAGMTFSNLTTEVTRETYR